MSKAAPAEVRRTTVAIRRVLDERELKVVFQPIVDLKSKKIFAYEALVRSLSSDFDSPMSLFAAAVQHQATGELGRIIRQLAVAGCPGHPLFLNIHPAELNEKWVVQPDDPIFQHSDDVYLEITEGVPLSHFRLCQSILREIRGRGVYLVVDDLGAGYSNLRYIADLHPRVVKLDRDLIAGLVQDTRMFKLVSAIVVLCKELDAMVVAEGIETPQELDAVIAAGARFGQGYLLARPAFPPPQIAWPTAAAMQAAAAPPKQAAPPPKPASAPPKEASAPPKRAEKATIKATDSYMPPPPSTKRR